MSYNDGWALTGGSDTDDGFGFQGTPQQQQQAPGLCCHCNLAGANPSAHHCKFCNQGIHPWCGTSVGDPEGYGERRCCGTCRNKMAILYAQRTAAPADPKRSLGRSASGSLGLSSERLQRSRRQSQVYLPQLRRVSRTSLWSSHVFIAPSAVCAAFQGAAMTVTYEFQSATNFWKK